MALGTNPEEDFEDSYTNKLRGLLVGSGMVIEYKRDRAAIDLGLHLAVKGRATQSRVWFQLKGKHTATLPLRRLQAMDTIPVEVELEHLRFWYASPEAVYIVAYLEATDEFIAEDVRDIVERQWGHKFLQPSTFPQGQQQVTVRLQKAARFDKLAIGQLIKHRSMRIDGPQWRGRPLGHNLDPLRSSLAPLEPSDYIALVNRLLEVHGFEVLERLDPALLLTDMVAGEDEATLLRGRMHYTYEWTHPMFTEFGFGDDLFRIEGKMLSVQGDCFVLIHSRGNALPNRNAALDSLAKKYGCKHLLVFVNRPLQPKEIGAFRTATEVARCVMPQDLGSLAFSVLTATSVYLEFRDRIGWQMVNYQI